MSDDVDEEIRRARLPRLTKQPRPGVRWKSFAEIHDRKTWPQPKIPAGIAHAIGAEIE